MAMLTPDHLVSPRVGLAERAGVSWRERAACRGKGTALFFTDYRSAEAKEVCASCPVRTECTDYALTAGIRWGIWGGHSVAERQRIGRLSKRGRPAG